MVEVSVLVTDQRHPMRLKLEAENPWGSIKDRTARSLLDELEKSAPLEPGAMIVESSSGNAGVALAALSRQRGYRFTAVVDPRTSPANIQNMKKYGALVDIVTDPDEYGGYLLTRLKRVEELVKERGYHWTDQYSSPANPEVHYRETGPELWSQAGDDCDAVFVAVSTGGTLAGVARYLRELDRPPHIEAVDVVGSVIFGGASAPRRLVGIGSSRKSDFLTPHHYDGHTLVEDVDAVGHCRALSAGTGIRVGGSSGAVLAAATRFLRRHPDTRSIACLCPDGGDRYLDSIYGPSSPDEPWPHNSTVLEDIRYG
ncbi:pyridoxal-phosphate dependent enzyme [Phytomonospora endophytica]|uniref:2,3-diaminopropionate biosynthesis protein SbnA n=2 Tax=Phytomonospora endophytica TaxID=714109 RepID=A0A841G334_9ACTN|nr:pyridoxal-phosphate dependent enzyme [Phytomonospora endophytica]MBB6040037.1 2,3-diaminopropionate biosynthesis protein SbnA [Phytomonospora endophytica]